MKPLGSPPPILLKSVTDTAIVAPVMRCVRLPSKSTARFETDTSFMKDSVRPIFNLLEGRSVSLVPHMPI